jgi:Uncharacterised ArCR, COG2043
VQPDPSYLLDKLAITLPLTGLYDAPDPAAFAPLAEPNPKAKRGQCLFLHYRDWQRGVTSHLTPENYGCGGAGGALCGVERLDRAGFIHFLAIDEGLKASEELMGEWLDERVTFAPRHGHVLVGPLKADLYDYLVTATFWVNPDQLSALVLAAQYRNAPSDPPPTVVTFSSGCGQLATFADLAVPQAQIGSTDIAMRQYLPPDVLAFTVTRPLFEQLCAFGGDSFLTKPFLSRLRKARGGAL